MAGAEGFEPPTVQSVAESSIQLSYAPALPSHYLVVKEQVLISILDSQNFCNTTQKRNRANFLSSARFRFIPIFPKGSWQPTSGRQAFSINIIGRPDNTTLIAYTFGCGDIERHLSVILYILIREKVCRVLSNSALRSTQEAAYSNLLYLSYTISRFRIPSSGQTFFLPERYVQDGIRFSSDVKHFFRLFVFLVGPENRYFPSPLLEGGILKHLDDGPINGVPGRIRTRNTQGFKDLGSSI